KARNAAARPAATIMIDTRQPGSESWVYASGHVEILSGEDSQKTNAKILDRYLTQEAINDPRIGPNFVGVDDVTLSMVPQVWRSWSGKDVDEKFFGGLLGSSPEKWFRPVER